MQWISVPSTSESNSPNYQSQGLLNPHSGNHGGSASYSFTTDFRQSNQNTVEQGFSIYTNPLGSGCGSNRAGSCADGAEGGSGHREEKGATPSYRPVSPISPLSPSNLSSSMPNHLKSVSNYCITISPHNTMSPTLEAPTSPSSKMRKQHGHEEEDELGVKRGQHEHTHMEQGLQLSSIHHDCSNNESCGDRPNLCRICGKTYARPSTLKTHLRTHSGEKPYRCEDCNKSFSQAANLTAHVRTHSGEKPFKCNICDRRFSQSSSVTTHMRTHSGERPYRCRLCRKAFSDSSTLTKHLRIHSGEKPYQCKLCLLRFSQSGNLNRHMRVHGQHYAISM